MTRRIMVGLVAFTLLALTGCATIEPWERDHLATPGMEIDDTACHRFEHNYEVYREGAAGANGGKSGGGCGCT